MPLHRGHVCRGSKEEVYAVPLNWPGNTEWVISTGQATHADVALEVQEVQEGDAVLEAGRDLPEETSSVCSHSIHCAIPDIMTHELICYETDYIFVYVHIRVGKCSVSQCPGACICVAVRCAQMAR